TYDANGNTLSDPSGKSYSWDFENRLVSAVVPGSGTVTFKYDPFGRRIQKASWLGTTNYLYDGPETIEEIDNGGNVLARYTQGSDVDEPLSEVRSGTVSFYEQDGLGSVSSLTNSASTIAGTYSYDSFGNLTASTGTLVDPFQYTGREFDPETGRYYYRARYFDPTAGRFLGEDPLGFPGSGSNFYTYAGNDPASLSDPFGLCPTKKPKCKKCQTKVLAAVNSKIGVPVTLVGATAFPQGMPGTDAGDPGMRNGACNFDFFVPGYTPPPMLGNCGRYSPNFTGIGSSLHIVYPGGGACNPLNDPTTYAVDETGFYFTAHMDSGYVFSPLGGLTHGIVDVLLKVKHGC
ncbi:MAG: RHS repeat-associated core domain-containing protein, partial [Candidatus Sulfotelmatobacter sp.]